MHIDVLKPAELSTEQLAAWSQLQASDAALRSPFFRPEFTQAVAAVRDDVEVAVLHDAGRAVGFFPYQRGPDNTASPIGCWLSDYQGVIATVGLDWDPRQLLKDCRLAAWHFDHALAQQLPLAPFHQRMAVSPYMDISGGMAVYRAARMAAHSDEVSHAMRKTRKAGREIGTVRFEPHASPELLETLIQWKRRQYHQTGVIDVLQPPWTQALLRRVMEIQSTDFSGMLSALYFGERLAAIHLGLRCRDVLHYWLTTYDPELSRYSPGTSLLLEFVQNAESLGLRTIDLGKGDEQYKQRLMTGAIELAEGFVECRPMHAAFKSSWWTARNLVRRSPLRAPAKALAARLTPLYSRFVFRRA